MLQFKIFPVEFYQIWAFTMLMFKSSLIYNDKKRVTGSLVFTRKDVISDNDNLL